MARLIPELEARLKQETKSLLEYLKKHRSYTDKVIFKGVIGSDEKTIKGVVVTEQTLGEMIYLIEWKLMDYQPVCRTIAYYRKKSSFFCRLFLLSKTNKP